MGSDVEAVAGNEMPLGFDLIMRQVITESGKRLVRQYYGTPTRTLEDLRARKRRLSWMHARLQSRLEPDVRVHDLLRELDGAAIAPRDGGIVASAMVTIALVMTPLVTALMPLLVPAMLLWATTPPTCGGGDRGSDGGGGDSLWGALHRTYVAESRPPLAQTWARSVLRPNARRSIDAAMQWRRRCLQVLGVALAMFVAVQTYIARRAWTAHSDAARMRRHARALLSDDTATGDGDDGEVGEVGEFDLAVALNALVAQGRMRVARLSRRGPGTACVSDAERCRWAFGLETCDAPEARDCINLIGLTDLNCSISDNLTIIKRFYERKRYHVTVADIRNKRQIKSLNREIETIVCVQPFELHLFDFSNFKGKLSAFWVWEFKSLPKIFKEYEKYFDTIYTPSTFCSNVFRAHLMTPVEKISVTSLVHTYSKTTIQAHVIANQTLKRVLGKTKDQIKFGFCFDLNSSIIRKNPLNLVKAFNNLNDNSKALILKYRHPRNNRFVNAIEKDMYDSFIREVAKNSNIHSITDELEPLDLYKLYTHLDFYVSPHCGEGFGITIYDNMILGNKIVSPYYSGETEYLTREDIIELDHEETVILGLQAHPVYGRMREYKGAYVSAESIENCFHDLFRTEPNPKK